MMKKRFILLFLIFILGGCTSSQAIDVNAPQKTGENVAKALSLNNEFKKGTTQFKSKIYDSYNNSDESISVVMDDKGKINRIHIISDKATSYNQDVTKKALELVGIPNSAYIYKAIVEAPNKKEFMVTDFAQYQDYFVAVLVQAPIRTGGSNYTYTINIYTDKAEFDELEKQLSKQKE